MKAACAKADRNRLVLAGLRAAAGESRGSSSNFMAKARVFGR